MILLSASKVVLLVQRDGVPDMDQKSFIVSPSGSES